MTSPTSKPCSVSSSGAISAQIGVHYYTAAQRGGTATFRRHKLSVYILVVDDEPDVEALFRQQFRRDIRSDRSSLLHCRATRRHSYIPEAQIERLHTCRR